MKLFPPTQSLHSKSIDILGPLLRTPRGNRFLLMIMDHVTKLTRTVPLCRITATSVAQAFVIHWDFVYGPPATVLSENGGQFVPTPFRRHAKYSSHGSYRLQPTTQNAMARWIVSTAQLSPPSSTMSAIIHASGRLHKRTHACVHNNEVHRTTKLTPIRLVLSNNPGHLSIKTEHPVDAHTAAQLRHVWVEFLRHLMQQTQSELHTRKKR